MNSSIGNCDLPRRVVISCCCQSEGHTGPRDQHKKAQQIGRILMVLLLLSLSISLGCATVLTPMTPGVDSALKPDEGLVLGRIHVTGSGGEPLTSTDQPFHARFNVQWRVRDQALEKDFLVDGLPSDGPFLLKLPTGSYRLTAFSFDTALGIWQASLPTKFTVRSQVCTYLGAWELRMKVGFFDGSIVRHVLDQHALAENDLQTIANDRLSNPMVVELSSSSASPLLLTFRTQGTELTSPP